MKLHLGCGERYLKGYVNIDYPPAEHTVQSTSVCDVQADLLTLRYSPSSVEEVRLHHVFEHFTRPVACALLAIWHQWLIPGGVLHLEVPDFQAAARRALSRFSREHHRCVAERHIFGSQEAHWAVHCAGYTPKHLSAMLRSFGYLPGRISRLHWCGLDNLEIRACRSQKEISLEEFERRTAEYLRLFLVDESETEHRLLKVWMELWREQAEKGWARNHA